MASQQPKISDFLAKPHRPKPCNSSNVGNNIILIESSEESDTQEEPDVVEQENTMCSLSTSRIFSSISISAVVDSEDCDVQDVEQPMHQVSAAQHSDCNDVEEGSLSNNDNVQSDLVIDDRMEDSPVDTANVCSTLLVPQPCTCVGCTDYIKPNQPQEVAQSRVIHYLKKWLTY